jgi:hypothetical protein
VIKPSYTEEDDDEEDNDDDEEDDDDQFTVDTTVIGGGDNDESEDSDGEETNAQCESCGFHFFTTSGSALCVDCRDQPSAAAGGGGPVVAATRERGAAGAGAAAAAAAAAGAAAAAAAGEAPFVEDERFWLRDAGTPEDSGTADPKTPEPGSAMKCMGACGIKGARISYVAIVSFRFDCLRHVSFGLASVL